MQYYHTLEAYTQSYRNIHLQAGLQNKCVISGLILLHLPLMPVNLNVKRK